ncbi:MAG TPA: alpha-ketoglutarate-dependent dioxygenase AlkB [Chthoniobacterales bacterium]|nr:alpha-ketoglutarate-dependent dioxygenase AlkB [Chthoniobacterales bacterium]
MNCVGQIELFHGQPGLPEGFVYQADFISAEEEGAMVREIEQLPFVAPTMHGVPAKRRTVHFGRTYDFNTFRLEAAPPVPDFLLPLRERAASLIAHPADELGETLVTEYLPGAGIGWHRDAPHFGIIVGISLLAPCTMKFRRWPVQKGQATRTRSLAQLLAPRSAYVLAGEVRTGWQHHIPPGKELRYSITFRTLRQK